MKFEQNVQIEIQEYICLVKRIDGVVAQKTLQSELIRCKDCKNRDTRDCHIQVSLYGLTDDDYCRHGERKEE